MMKKLIYLILLLPFVGKAQSIPLAVAYRGNTPVNALDSIAYTYNGILPMGTYKWLYPAAYIRANFAPITGGGYAPSARQIINGYGITGGHSLATDVTLAVDTGTIFSNLVHKTGTETINGLKSFGNNSTWGTGNFVGTMTAGYGNWYDNSGASAQQLTVRASSIQYNYGITFATGLNFTIPTHSNSISFPDASGTVALKTDTGYFRTVANSMSLAQLHGNYRLISDTTSTPTAVVTYGKYKSNIDTLYNKYVQNLHISGSNGKGGIFIPYNNNDDSGGNTVPTPSSGVLIYSNGNKKFGWKDTNGNTVMFLSQFIGGNITLSLPATNGATLATINGGQTFSSANMGANIVYRTPTGTAGTDSIQVKCGSTGKGCAIAGNSYTNKSFEKGVIAGGFINSPNNPQFAGVESNIIQQSSGGAMDMWYRYLGGTGDTIKYAVSTNSPLDIYGTPTTCQLNGSTFRGYFPNVQYVGGRYVMQYSTSNPSLNVYMAESHDKIHWVGMNGGAAVFTHSTTPGSDWWNLFNTSFVQVGSNYYFLIETKNQALSSPYHIYYSVSDTTTLNFNTNLSTNWVINNGGEPDLHYIPSKSAFLVLHSLSLTNQSPVPVPSQGQIIAHYAPISGTLTDSTTWVRAPNFPIIQVRNIDISDPSLTEVTGNGESKLQLSYEYNQATLAQAYNNSYTLDEFYTYVTTTPTSSYSFSTPNQATFGKAITLGDTYLASQGGNVDFGNSFTQLRVAINGNDQYGLSLGGYNRGTSKVYLGASAANNADFIVSNSNGTEVLRAKFGGGLLVPQWTGDNRNTFSAKASAGSGGGSQPGLQFQNSSATLKFSTYWDAATDTYNISNAGGTNVFNMLQNGTITLVATPILPSAYFKNSTSGNTGLLAGASTGSPLISLPSSTSNLATLALSETFTNKNLTSGTNTFPTFNQNTTGSAASLSAASTLPNNTLATTQSAGDNSTKVETTAGTQLNITALKAAANVWSSTNHFNATWIDGGFGLNFTNGAIGGTLGGNTSGSGYTWTLPSASGTVALASQLQTTGQTTLTAGVSTITISGLTTSSTAVTGFVAIGGTVGTTWQYKAVCTANTLTITAITSAGATDVTDTSTINYSVKP